MVEVWFLLLTYFRIILSIPIWILFLVIRSSLIFLGYLMVPMAIIFSGYKTSPSMFYKNVYVRKWKCNLFWLWGNEEEGLGHYGNQDWPLWLRILYSDVLRNPANNLRFVQYLSLKIDPDKVNFVGSFGSSDDHLSSDVLKKYDLDECDFWSFSWQGFYSNFRWQGNFLGLGRRRFWIGWKIYPGDILGIPSWDHRTVSAGFATQFKRLKS